MQAGWYSKLDYQLHRVARDCNIYWCLGPDEFAEGMCERASCYARANLPRTVPKSYWSWLVANHEKSILTYTVVSSHTMEVHVPRHLYACLVKTEVPN